MPAGTEPPRPEIVDAHHHLWDLERYPASYPWLVTPSGGGHMGPYDPIRRSYRPDDYRRDTASVNVIKTVHIEAGRRASESLDETAWLQQQADANGWPNAIVAYVDLLDPAFEATIERHLGFANVRGARMRLTQGSTLLTELRPGNTLMSDKTFRAALGRLARHGLSFDLQAPQAVLGDAVALAQAFPDVQLVLTHAGFPLDRSAAGLRAWRDGLAEAARADNTVLKLSGIAMTDHHWTDASLAEIIVAAVDIFGPDRTMFGTNFPVDSLYSTPERLLAAHLAAISRYTAEEQRMILVDTASRTYRI